MIDHPGYIDNILIFLCAAVGVVFLFRRMKASPMLGYLVAGTLIGPHLTGLVDDPTEIQFLGELGVIFLLFTIGLELPLQRLMALKKYVFGLGTAQVLLTGIVFSFVGYSLGFPLETSILVGSALALSSTAVVMQILTERGELAARFGRVSFAILLLQDLAVVLLLVLVTTLGADNTSVYSELGYSALKAILGIAIIIVLGRSIFRPLYRAVAGGDNAELFMATTFLVILGTSFLTELAGLSLELGAFLAGMLLAETEYRHQIEADIEPFRGLLLGVFFMSVGMTIDLSILIHSFGQVLLALALMLLLKGGILIGLCRLFGLRLSSSLRVGLLLAGGGEFVFVVFSPTIVEKFLPPGMADILFITVAISMALTPLLSLGGQWLGQRLQRFETQADIQSAAQELGELKDHVIIAGWGRVGQMVGELLAERLIPYVAIDNDMRRVVEGRSKGLPVFYGDARRLEVLKALDAENAKAAVVTLNQMTGSVRAVMTLRRKFPEVPVCVRIRDEKHFEKLIHSGAKLVIPETLEPSIQLASSILHLVGTPSEEVNQIIDTYRRQKFQLAEVD